ncbi:MAG: c-type cytochrome [Halioglobus sp.]|jgi:cytochrome subunit of sulfide dehydrogenase
MARAYLFAAVLAAVFWQPVTAVADDEFKLCARCHGADGNSSKSNSPSIAGLDAQYMERAMKEYRDGERPCGLSSMKCKMAAKWTDEEIAAAAVHFSAMKQVAPQQEFDAGLAAAGKKLHEEHCAGCHGEKAAEGKPHGSHLNGQWREYLEYALGQYQAGVWPQPDDMKAALAKLSEEDRNALLNYYASGQ